MKALFNSSVKPDVLVRALGISLVVLDHAFSFHKGPFVLAGLNMLLIVSGYSFARFLKPNASASEIRSSLFQYGKALAVPCVVALVISALIFQKLSVPDLFLVGNWVSNDHVAFFPAWYPMEFLQYILLLAMIMSIPGLASAYARCPLLVSLGLLCFAVAERFVLTKIWALNWYFDGRGPHIMFWNLMAGWCVYNAARLGKTEKSIVFTAIAVCTLATWGPTTMRFATTLCSVGCILWISYIHLPFVIARTFLILSQSALSIFLFHMPMLYLFNHLTGTENTLPSFIFSITSAAAIWVLLSASVRAYKTLGEHRAVGIQSPA